MSKENFGEEKREGRSQHAYAFIHDKNPYEHMQFDVIIGNPPYQMSTTDDSIQAKTIYHLFIQQAIKMNPKYLCMIVPSRWFSGGMGLDKFRGDMLNDRRLKEIHDYTNASDIFPSVKIGGGINYFLWQSDYKGDCLIKTYKEGECISEMKRPLKEEGLETFIRYNEAIPILRKVQAFGEKSFSEVVSSQKPFGLPTNFKSYKKDKFPDSIQIFGNKYVGYVDEDSVLKNKEYINSYKVLISRIYTVAENFPELIINKPFVAEPNSCCTETYLVIGPFANKERCENVISYMKTRFFRFLVLLIKNTQDALKRVYQFVPQQKFDKPWTDEELYQKYGLTEEEIAYIESMVRPME